MPATTIRVTNATATQLSLVGDEGKPRVDISSVGGSNYADINMTDVVGNILLCDTLSSWITAGTVTVTRGGVTVTAAQMTAFKTAMTSDIYDSDADGISDEAEQLNFVSATDVATAASPYTVLVTDTVIDADVSGGAVQLNLPAIASANDGRVITIYDSTGNAATNNITIAPNGTDEIDGVNSNLVLSADRSVINLRSNGVDGWLTDTAQVRSLATAGGGVAVGVATAAIDVKAVAESTGDLNGLAAQDFAPQSVIVHLTAFGTPLNGDAVIKIGTTTGGTEILPLTTLTGLNALNETFQIALTGNFPVIAGNATLYVNVTTADTGVGTGTANVIIEGKLL